MGNAQEQSIILEGAEHRNEAPFSVHVHRSFLAKNGVLFNAA